MMADTAVDNRAKRVKFFRNGDKQFTGQTFTINRKHTRDIDSLLDMLTNKLHLNRAARGIRTPEYGKRTIRTLDDLEDQGEYVVVSGGSFKKIGYKHLHETNVKRLQHAPLSTEGSRTSSSLVKPVEHSRIQVAGRARTVPTNVITIYVFANGRAFEKPNRVTLGDHQLKNWETILTIVTDKARLESGCMRLYTYDDAWQRVTDAGQLRMNQEYVAVGKERELKKLPYGKNIPNFSTAPQKRTLKPIKMPKNKRQSRHGYASTTTTDTSHTTSQSRTDDEQSPKMQRNKPKKEEDSVFHAKPIKHKRSSDGARIKSHEEDEDSVFKGKRSQIDDADEVQDSKDTKTDLPLDQQEAEEVMDEEIEEDKPIRKAPDARRAPKKSHSEEQPKVKPVVAKPKKKPKKVRTPTPEPVESDQSPTPRSPTPNEESPRTPSPQKRRSITPKERSQSPADTRAASQQSNHAEKEDDKEDSKSLKDSENEDDEEDANENPQEDKNHEDSEKTNEENQEERNAAATKIQSAYRGYSTRKSLNSINSTDQQDEDKEQSPREEEAPLQEDIPKRVKKDDNGDINGDAAITVVQEQDDEGKHEKQTSDEAYGDAKSDELDDNPAVDDNVVTTSSRENSPVNNTANETSSKMEASKDEETKQDKDESSEGAEIPDQVVDNPTENSKDSEEKEEDHGSSNASEDQGDEREDKKAVDNGNDEQGNIEADDKAT